MIDVRLWRLYLGRESYTMGKIQIGDLILKTLELPWNNNQRLISCIPAGEYICERVISLKFGETFQIMDVPDRSEILFHAGNYPHETHGCVLLGKTSGLGFIGESRKAMTEFMRALEGVNKFKLIIS